MTWHMSVPKMSIFWSGSESWSCWRCSWVLCCWPPCCLHPARQEVSRTDFLSLTSMLEWGLQGCRISLLCCTIAYLIVLITLPSRHMAIPPTSSLLPILFPFEILSHYPKLCWSGLPAHCLVPRLSPTGPSCPSRIN